jgi:hypothetical protein
MSLSATEFLRIALDPHRLAVMGLAATGPLDIEVAARQLSLTVAQVRKAVSRLVEAGLLDSQLGLDHSTLRALAATLPDEEPVSPVVLQGPWSKDEREVLGRFFTGTRLQEIPAHNSRRRVVLERLAQEFEIGLRYTEKEINSMLQVFHPDYASLRRYLVDEGFLSRADGSYWRTGGRVEVSQ